MLRAARQFLWTLPLLAATVLLSSTSTPLPSQPIAHAAAATPDCETPGTDTFSPTLQWSTDIQYIQPPTYQYHLQLFPFNNDGPGIDLIQTKTTADPEAFQVQAPPVWYVLLPDMSYTWRVRLSDATVPIGPDDTSWSDWSEWCSFRTPVVSSAAITAHAPSEGAVGQSRTAILQWSNLDTSVFYYEVQLSKDASFTLDPASATAAVYWNFIHGGVTDPLNSYLIPPSSPLAPGIKYYWRVRPRVQGWRSRSLVAHLLLYH